MLAGDHCEIGQMTITGADPMPVIHDHGPPVATEEISISDRAVGRSHYRSAIGTGDVDSAMECAFSVERINALSE